MAFKGGRLTGKDQSRIQRWALGYYQYTEKRDQSEREYETNKLLHLILKATNSKLYDLAYPNIESDDPDVIPGHTYGVEDLEGLEKLIASLDSVRSTTQTSLDKDSWTDWR